MLSQTSGDLTEVLTQNQKLYPPNKTVVKKSHVVDYEKTLKSARRNPKKFWAKAAEEIDWFRKWDKILDESNKPFYKWFVGGKTNLAYNALDRHIGTKTENKKAILYEDEKGNTQQYSYLDLYYEVNQLVNALKKLKIKKGDRIAIYMPNIPQTAIALLACTKLGAIHSVVYAGYSAKALEERIKDAQAKILITADGSYRRGKYIQLKTIADKAADKCKTIKKVIVVKHNKQKIKFNKKKDIWYHQLIETESRQATATKMDAEDIAFVLYTSGTTSKPKGVVHVHGGYAVNVLRTIKWVFNLHGDEIFWCTADPGWITGHSYIIYGPLMAGVTTLMYEGVPDKPKPDNIWKIIEKYKVNVLYTAPTLIRLMMKYGTQWPRQYKMNSLRILGSVGEPINPEAWKWFYKYVGKNRCPIMDTWWQTETGANMITPLPSAPLKAGSAGKPFPGIIADVVDKKGKPVPQGKGGYLVIKNQWPSIIRTIFKNPERYKKTYWQPIKGYYFSGDVAFKDKDGYFWIQGRTDDVLKVAGHRLGTAEIESAFVHHPSVVEAGVIGLPDPIKGESIKAFIILKQKIKGTNKLKEELRQTVRHTIGPVAVIKDIEFVDKLPKTRSGKIMRRVLKAKELGQPLGDTSALV